MDWYFDAFKKYAVFEKGRASREAFWMYMFFHAVITMSLDIIDEVLGTPREERFGFGLLGVIYYYASFLPSFAVGARRLHDTNHSGLWQVLYPVAFIFFLLDSQPGENRFGPNPKERHGA